jgi:hypothetical protein
MAGNAPARYLGTPVTPYFDRHGKVLPVSVLGTIQTTFILGCDKDLGFCHWQGGNSCKQLDRQVC